MKGGDGIYPPDVLAGALLAVALFLLLLSLISYRRSGVRAALAVFCISLIILLKNLLYVMEVLHPGVLPFEVAPETLILDVLLLLAIILHITIRRRSALR